MSKLIFSIDPSTSTGLAMFVLNEKTKVLTLIQSAVVAGTMDEIGVVIRECCVRFKPDEVYIEDYMFQMRARQGANVNSEIRGMIKWLVKDNLGYYPTVLKIGTWKKLATGSGRADKAMIKASMEALGFECNRSLVNGKYLKWRDDESDAIAMGIAGLHGRWGAVEDFRPSRA